MTPEITVKLSNEETLTKQGTIAAAIIYPHGAEHDLKISTNGYPYHLPRGSYRTIIVDLEHQDLYVLRKSSDEDYVKLGKIKESIEFEGGGNESKIVKCYAGGTWNTLGERKEGIIGITWVGEHTVTQQQEQQLQQEQQQVEQTTPQKQIDSDAIREPQPHQEEVQQQVQQTNQEEGVPDQKKNEVQNLPL